MTRQVCEVNVEALLEIIVRGWKGRMKEDDAAAILAALGLLFQREHIPYLQRLRRQGDPKRN